MAVCYPVMAEVRKQHIVSMPSALSALDDSADIVSA